MPETVGSAGDDWRPTVDASMLRQRAALLRRVRRFFEQREVLEVETPLLSAATVTDLHLYSLSCQVDGPDGSQPFYLQTSPEFAMKRLLASGSGPIFQICKAFRDAERGTMHNPEFTMLEWYRPGFDHHRLMDEMDDLLAAVLAVPTAERRTYGDLFQLAVGLDPHRAEIDALESAAARLGMQVVGLEASDRDTWLHLLWSHAVEPDLGSGRPTFVLDFPASQAALARLRTDTTADGDVDVAERFEVYIDGVELANGFHELSDASEQRRRFEQDLVTRRRHGRPPVHLDERLLAALQQGIGDCAGVALGLDRLLMLQVGSRDIAEVLAFPIARA